MVRFYETDETKDGDLVKVRNLCLVLPEINAYLDKALSQWQYSTKATELTMVRSADGGAFVEAVTYGDGGILWVQDLVITEYVEAFRAFINLWGVDDRMLIEYESEK